MTTPHSPLGDRLEDLLRDIAEGHEPGDVTTLRDASILTQLRQSASPPGTGGT